MALEVMPDHVHLFVKHDPKASASYVTNLSAFQNTVPRVPQTGVSARASSSLR
ncbi:hypothetical protein [Streptomyces sp. NPDC001530]|uniref:hypothetical protein n=1 Tax=Streptomyces sp. NPDC001530 TaxID=3364582 RepID=UPI0036D16346